MRYLESDFRLFLVDLGKQLTEENVKSLQLLLLRKFKVKEISAIDFLNELIQNGVIQPADVTKLIRALRELDLNVCANNLEKYQEDIGCDAELCFDSSKFAGRINELEMIDEHVGVNEGRFCGVFISGMPGIGKTFLAQEFLQRHVNTKGMKSHFINCRGMDNIQFMISELIKALDMSIQEMNFKVLERKLKFDSNQFILIDNVEDIMEHNSESFTDFIKKFVDTASGIKNRENILVVTSRRSLPEIEDAALKERLLPVKLDIMTTVDSGRLIRLYMKERELDFKDMVSLAELCGHHPLSMALLANRLRISEGTTFSMIQKQMQKSPLMTLSNVKEFECLESVRYIENSLEHMFNCLKEDEQELLIRLSLSPHDMSEKTLKDTYMDPTAHSIDLAISRLCDLNLISSSGPPRGSSRDERYSMHLLTKHFVNEFCKHEECPIQLKKCYDIAKDSLLSSYAEDIQKLSQTEYVNPKQYAEIVIAEKLNYLGAMADIYDKLIAEKADFRSFDALDDVHCKIFYNTNEHANFLKERTEKLPHAGDGVQFKLYLQIHYADMIRLNGELEEALKMYKEIKGKLVTEDSVFQENVRLQLQTLLHRYYGRALKDTTSGNVILALKKSISLLEAAIKGYQSDTYRDPDSQQKELAGVNYDLGNAYFSLSNASRGEREKCMEKARNHFQQAKKIYESFDKKMSKIFDIELSLASCDMELYSWFNSVDGRESRETLAPALKHYEDAEEIMKANVDLISSDPVRMGNLHYSRAVCHFRAGQHEAAVVDAKKAYRHRRLVFGSHNKTMCCVMLLGDIYCSSFGIKHRNRRAFKCYEQAWKMAIRLASRGKEVMKADLDRLEFHLTIMCERLGKDCSNYDKYIKAIKDKAVSISESDPRYKSSDESSSEETEGPSGMELKTAFERDGEIDSSCDSLDEEKIAPSVKKARKLSEDLNVLMKKHAHRLSELKDVMDVDDMTILVGVLRSGYPNMPGHVRKVRYDRGTNLLKHLTKLDEQSRPKVEEAGTEAEADSDGKTMSAVPVTPTYGYLLPFAIVIAILSFLIYLKYSLK